MVFCDDERHLLALEADLVGGQHRLHVVGQGRHPRQSLFRQVGAGHDGLDLRMRLCRSGVDAHYAGVRERRTQHRQMQHAGQLHVVDVVAPAPDEPGILLAQHPAVAARLLVVVDGSGLGPVIAVDWYAAPGLQQRLGTLAAMSGLCLRLRREFAFGRPGFGGASARMGGRPLDGSHDRGVAGTAADLPGDGLADGLLVGVGHPVEQSPRGDHHPWRAEPALQPVTPHEAFLHRVQEAVDLKTLDRADAAAAGHRCEHGAGLHRFAVHFDDAGAAVAGVAAPVGSSEPQLIPQKMHEQCPGLDLGGGRLAVDGHVHLHR